MWLTKTKPVKVEKEKKEQEHPYYTPARYSTTKKTDPNVSSYIKKEDCI